MERTITRQLLSKLNYVKVLNDFESPLEALNLIKTGGVDLVLLDVEMPEMSGLEFLSIDNAPLVIIISGKKDYAFEAYEFSVVDYLLKPLKADRFIRSINRAKELFDQRSGKTESDDNEYLFIREKGVLIRVKLADINFIHAQGDYVTFSTCEKNYTIRMPLKNIEEKLPARKFLRVHRSYIVALDRVETLEENTIGIDKNLIPLSDMYRTEFLQRLNMI